MTQDEYRTALDELFQRRRFGIRPGLETVEALLAELDHPERKFPAVHITGSKGKGSTAVMTQAILSAHGVRTGLFTSPHLVTYRERARIDGRPIPKSAVVEGLKRVAAAAKATEAAGRTDHPPTFFEVTTALAFDWFAREQVDAAVVEVGIGGRLDSTNVLDSRVGVITTIELEHTEILGPDLSSIAREKSGIFHRGMTGVVGDLPAEARTVVEAAATSAGVPLWHAEKEVRVEDRTLSAEGQSFTVRVPGRSFSSLSVPLLGRFQPTNAGLAVAAALRFAQATGRDLEDGKVAAGLAHVRWPGRLERMAKRPELFYDVAHTPESARAVTQSLAEISPLADPEESVIVFGCLREKDAGTILDALSPLARTIVVVPIRSDRGARPADLRVAAAGRFPRIVEARSPAEGLAVARAGTGPDGLTLVVGSDYLVGELLREADDVDEPDLSDPGVSNPKGPPAVEAGGRRAAG
ncbi:MAG TPA: folylpolyglutamate synthase/dihydrofolate synthase family protein [Thermoplasmata archaeon]|nr:folylpolyglutamate synthase/dihydrofolate synthase family protein [Thermoplasmata archaeon]